MILFIALCRFECLGKYVQAYVERLHYWWNMRKITWSFKSTFWETSTRKYTGDFVFKTNLLTYITQDKWMNIRIFDNYPLRQSYMAEILAF